MTRAIEVPLAVASQGKGLGAVAGGRAGSIFRSPRLLSIKKKKREIFSCTTQKLSSLRIDPGVSSPPPHPAPQKHPVRQERKLGKSSLLKKLLWLKFHQVGCEGRRAVRAPWWPVTGTSRSWWTRQKVRCVVLCVIGSLRVSLPEAPAASSSLSPPLSPLPGLGAKSPSHQGAITPASTLRAHLSALSTNLLFPALQREASVQQKDIFPTKLHLRTEFESIVMARDPMRAWGKNVRETGFTLTPVSQRVTPGEGNGPNKCHVPCRQRYCLLFSGTSKSG